MGGLGGCIGYRQVHDLPHGQSKFSPNAYIGRTENEQSAAQGGAPVAQVAAPGSVVPERVARAHVPAVRPCRRRRPFRPWRECGVVWATGLMRLPNAGGIKWRKQDNSGDLGLALNASNHLGMDAVIDFATGQTFGAFSYPDATTAAKGLVQVDVVGGIAVAAGVLSLADTAVTPGTYTKTTVDQQGRVTAGASLLAGDLPNHTQTASDIVAGSLPFTIQNNGAAIGTGCSPHSAAIANAGQASSKSARPSG